MLLAKRHRPGGIVRPHDFHDRLSFLPVRASVQNFLLSKAEAAAKRDLFIKAFIANAGNATQAAISVGYSAKTAKQAGSRMLTYVDVSSAIEAQRRTASESAGLAVERTLWSRTQGYPTSGIHSSILPVRKRTFR
jgi:Terminase small subunit